MKTVDIQHLSTQQIQEEIDAALHDGGKGKVRLKGEHVLTKTLHLQPGARLSGVPGQKTVLRTTDHNMNFIEVVPGSDAADTTSQRWSGLAPNHVEISHLHLLGPRTSIAITDLETDSAIQGCGIFVSAELPVQANGAAPPLRGGISGSEPVVEAITIRDCRIENVSGCGIRFHTRQDVLMHNIKILNCVLVQNGRPPEAPPPNNKIGQYKDIFFYGTRFDDILIQGNRCVFTPQPPPTSLPSGGRRGGSLSGASTYGNDSGIAFVCHYGNRKEARPTDPDWKQGLVSNTKILDNVCSGHRRHGIITNYGYLVAENVEVRRNKCHNNRWVGIYVNMGKHMTGGSLTIEDNQCHHNGFGGLDQPIPKTERQLQQEGDAGIRGGIVLNLCFNARIAGNECHHNGKLPAGFRGQDVTRKKASGIRVRGGDLDLDFNVMEGNAGGEIARWQAESFEATGIKIKRVGAAL